MEAERDAALLACAEARKAAEKARLAMEAERDAALLACAEARKAAEEAARREAVAVAMRDPMRERASAPSSSGET
eukprot:8660673-Lingulodinium_polyedra.AAC.1